MSVKKYLDKLQDLKGHKVIVTGGTSGIGLSIVKELLIKGANVVIMARNLEKANKVKSRFIENYKDRTIDIIKYDQSDDESIVEAAKVIINEHSDFYALVMNAGIFQGAGKTTYVNDIPLTLKTNFVGVKVLLDHLLDELKGKHRFIFQGSLAAGYRIRKLNSLKVNKISAWQQYLISKAGVESLYFYYSQKEYRDFSFYLVEPGITNTEIIREFPTPIKQLGHAFMICASHSPDKAALTAMLALQENVEPCFIVPRGLFSWSGYPKIKKFPKKREKTYLLDLLNII